MRAQRTPAPRWAALLWPCLLLLGGCAAKAKPVGSQDVNAAAQPAANPAASAAAPSSSFSSSPLADAVRERLTNTSDGLELRRWTIIDEPGRMMAALTKYSAGPAVDPVIQHQLKRNGFRFLRVRAAELESLLAELGGANVDATEWHGQAPEWRAVLSRAIGEGGRAVAIDGLVRRYERGEFRLMMRSWTVQMEDGPYVHMEMLPRRTVPHANDLRRLFGEEVQAGQGFGSMALNLQLQAGNAYVLVSESPRVGWPGIDGEAEPGAEEAGANAKQQAAVGGRMGPDEALGPDALTPPTLGELFLAPELEPPRRGILVFVPKISPELLLPGQMESLQRHQAGQPASTSRGSSG